jgi:hypothetical protein
MKSNVLALVTIVTAFLLSACGGSSTNSNPSTPPVPSTNNGQSVAIPFGPGKPDVNDHIIKTPGGMTLRSVDDVPLNVQLAMDQGAKYTLDTDNAITDLFPVGKGYQTLDQIQIFIIPKDFDTQENDPGAPGLNVYYNTGTNIHPKYDYIPSAGTTVGSAVTGQQLGGYNMYLSVVIGSGESSNWSHVQWARNSVRNEVEHAKECTTAANVCLQFQIAGDVHPHYGDDIWNWPLPTQPTTLVSTTRKFTPKPCSNVADCKPIAWDNATAQQERVEHKTQMSVKCFFVEPSNRVRRSLRRYETIDALVRCEVCPGGYHQASEYIGDFEKGIDGEGVELMSPPVTDYAGDTRWPQKALCGRAFNGIDDTFQIFDDRIYIDRATQKEYLLRDNVPGMMWDAAWMPDRWKGSDGRSLVVVCPNGIQWMIDSVANNCTDSLKTLSIDAGAGTASHQTSLSTK